MIFNYEDSDDYDDDDDDSDDDDTLFVRYPR
jgi:hypothetical protein